MRMHQLLFEAKATKTVAIYPGRFHPFHKGHKFVYDYLSKKYGTVYIATSDKQEEGSPFSFEEKNLIPTIFIIFSTIASLFLTGLFDYSNEQLEEKFIEVQKTNPI